MPEIQLLDQATINQIAAGEVIDRPSSVVKELLENAIDAKATAITVEIKDGGISFIRITDNGCGIEKDQVRKAFLRHATSKLHTIDDLLDIGSLGFRGEALSSIAAIAQVELISKPPEAMLGISYQIEDGEEKSLTQIGAPDGTTILVRNLFYHVPARKKFLKTAATEGNYINQLMENMAMLRPDISMRFINGGQNKLYTSGNGRLKDLIYTIYGREISSNVLEINYECPLFAVTGYIGKPIISRGNRTFENYYINGRFVKSRLIAAAIEQAYKPFMMQHRYPFTVLHIKIKPELIDVNVHPAKMEVRFQQENEIYELLAGAIENTLRGKEFIPDVSDDGKAEKKVQEKQKLPEPFEQRRLQAMKEIIPPPPAEHKTQNEQKPSAEHKTQSEQKLPRNEEQPNVPSKLSEPVCEYKAEKKQTIKDSDSKWESASGIHKRIGQDVSQTVNQMPTQPEQKLEKPEQQTLFTEPLLSEKARIHHRLIGQLFDTYWLIQYGNQLYIMDQHAAHEKVMYEKLKKDLENNTIVQQMVAPPVILTFSIKEQQKFKICEESFKKLGFLIEEFGGNEYCIRGVPANLLGIDPQELFIEIFDQIEENSGKMNLEMITDRLATMACKAAVKGNTAMSYQEMDALMDQLMKLDNPYQCPHGRPTIISMTKYELEKKFKRVQ